jgi:hypothetical protein
MSKEAMKLALEALDMMIVPRSFQAQVRIKEIYETIEAELTKQEQGEPVALKVYRGELCYKSQADDQSFGMWCPVTQDLPFPEGTKFYTTPQQSSAIARTAAVGEDTHRAWVGLTDEEIRACIASNKYAFEIVRAAETKLKEKNT